MQYVLIFLTGNIMRVSSTQVVLVKQCTVGVVLDRLAGPGQTGLRQTVFYPESECPVCSAGRAVQPGQARQDVTGLYLQSALSSGSLAPA